MMTMKLLNPGPVTLTSRVREALLRPDMCHRESEFADLTLNVMKKLGAVYADPRGEYVPVLLTGSGTAAVEAMVSSLAPRTGRTLVVANGVYGERAAAMLEAQGKPFDMVGSAWTEPMNLLAVEKAFASKAYTHAIAVHHETTTGRLNDLHSLGRLCKDHGVGLLLDAVSSFGGEEIKLADWNIQGCAATANKCLHGVPGIAFVLAKKAILESGATNSPSVYLDLFRYFKEQKTGFSPFTQSVHAMFALDEALSEFADGGGWVKRNARYRSLSHRAMSGLADMGIGLFLESKEAYSSILTAYRMPSRVSYDRLHDQLKRRGFIIYAGQGQFAGSIFRIAVMGDLSSDDVDRLLREIRDVIA